jgi:hypothetical protein
MSVCAICNKPMVSSKNSIEMTSFIAYFVHKRCINELGIESVRKIIINKKIKYGYGLK